MGEQELWIVFAIVFAALMLYDLLIVERRKGVPTTKRSMTDVIIYMAISLAFGGLVAAVMGTPRAAEFYTAYIIEFAMSVDNLFVFILLFASFGIVGKSQHKVLFYGIMGAIVFRALFVVIGAGLLERFDWMMLIFGAILILTAFRTSFGGEKDPKDSFAYKAASKLHFEGDSSSGRFFIKVNGKTVATTMVACLLVIELTDLMFAFDSIPAALSISTNVFIVFSSNILAVMGLRSLYFVLKGYLDKLCYMKYGLGVILAFIGAKMFMSYFGYEMPVVLSLVIIIVVLAVTVVLSITKGPRHDQKSDETY
jgi:tellurite resistance protein TerC